MDYFEQHQERMVGLKDFVDFPPCYNLSVVVSLPPEQKFSTPLHTVVPCSNANQAIEGLLTVKRNKQKTSLLLIAISTVRGQKVSRYGGQRPALK